MPETPFLTARWHHLVMANYEIAPSAIQPFVPAGTETFHRNFDEVNLRLYVRRDVGGEIRRGVVFVKEVVPRRALSRIHAETVGEPFQPGDTSEEAFITEH